VSLIAQYCELPVAVTCKLYTLRMGEELLAFSTKYHVALKNSVGDNHLKLGRVQEALQSLEYVLNKQRTW